MKILSAISLLEILGEKENSSFFFFFLVGKKTLDGTLAFPYHYYNQHCYYKRQNVYIDP